MRLFHTGFSVIEKPDVFYGRPNADFGRGFYLSDDEAFSLRWAKERSGQITVLNEYELMTEGLHVKCFDQDAEWFDYIFHNRAGYPDSLLDTDVIVGPIAGDTLYDTWGIITSGLLSASLSLELLLLAPFYRQIVLKTPKAADRLRFIRSREITPGEIALYRETVLREERDYQEKFARRLQQEPE